MEVITFYGYKGGTGRSLALANAAHGLARSGYRVVALDFDLEAPGLHHKLLGPDVPLPPAGLLDFIARYTDADADGGPGDIPDIVDLIVPAATYGLGSIDVVVAGGLHPTTGGLARYWERLLDIDWRQLVREEVGARMLAALRAQLRDYGADYVLVDARTGVTEIGQMTTVAMADCVVGFALPNEESTSGLEQIFLHLGQWRPGMRLTTCLGRTSSERAKDADVALYDGWRLRLARVGNQNPGEVVLLHNDDVLQDRESVLLAELAPPLDRELTFDYLRLLRAAAPGAELSPLLEQVMAAPTNGMIPAAWRQLAVELYEIAATPRTALGVYDALTRSARFSRSALVAAALAWRDPSLRPAIVDRLMRIDVELSSLGEEELSTRLEHHLAHGPPEGTPPTAAERRAGAVADLRQFVGEAAAALSVPQKIRLAEALGDVEEVLAAAVAKMACAAATDPQEREQALGILATADPQEAALLVRDPEELLELLVQVAPRLERVDVAIAFLRPVGERFGDFLMGRPDVLDELPLAFAVALEARSGAPERAVARMLAGFGMSPAPALVRTTAALLHGVGLLDVYQQALGTAPPTLAERLRRGVLALARADRIENDMP